MSETAEEFSLAELMIVAAAEVYRDQGEILATGIGIIPRLAASLAMKTFNPDMMMTDSEAWVLSEPNPVSGLAGHEGQTQESWLGFGKIFDNVWSGARHALVGPSQMDRFGQTNISALGQDYSKPSVQMLGVRGYPGNSINHPNSYVIPAHSTRVFVEGECDTVCSIGYNPERLPKGYSFDDIKIGRVITDLAVLDYNGPDHQARVVSLHPGVSFEEVQSNTGFTIHRDGEIPTTAAPSKKQLEIIQSLDPLNIRAKQIKGNPAGIRISPAEEPAA